jgi:hypothetical protein
MRTQARERGVYPEIGEPLYGSERVSITVNLPAGLWLWLKGFVGKNSFFYCVEETIVTALRSMAGREADTGMNLETLVHLVSMERNITAAEAMFGRLPDPESAKLANIFLQAAQRVAHGIDDVAESGLPEGEEGELMLKAWSAAAGRDIAVDIEAARVERMADMDAETQLPADARPEKFKAAPSRKSGELDDNIPF